MPGWGWRMTCKPAPNSTGQRPTSTRLSLQGASPTVGPVHGATHNQRAATWGGRIQRLCSPFTYPPECGCWHEQAWIRKYEITHGSAWRARMGMHGHAWDAHPPEDGRCHEQHASTNHDELAKLRRSELLEAAAPLRPRALQPLIGAAQAPPQAVGLVGVHCRLLEPLSGFFGLICQVILCVETLVSACRRPEDVRREAAYEVQRKQAIAILVTPSSLVPSLRWWPLPTCPAPPDRRPLSASFL